MMELSSSITSSERVTPSRLKKQLAIDFGFSKLTLSCALITLAIFLAMVISLSVGAWPAIKTFGFHFLTSTDWDPVGQNFGALSPMIGTLITSFIALIIAVPVSLGIAVFLTELSPGFLRGPLRTTVELLAAIPSIIYGMWGLFSFAPFFAKNIQPWLNEHGGPIFHGPPMGIGILTASFILSIMIIPFIASVMRDVFEVVPPMLKESAYGMGATTWEVVWYIVIPTTRAGITGGIILGLGRALGETMAVTFVIGNAHALTRSLVQPGNTISSTLANEFTEAVGELYNASLVELGLMLFVITFCVLALAKVLLLRVQKKEGARS